MGTSLRLGRIAGIELGLNWSWLVVFALLVWTLTTGIFPSTNPRLSGVTHFAMAVVATLLFFCSLLLHELRHALIARREGMQIEGITLWLFGSVAKFKGAFPSAGAELRVAVAGALVSLLLGVLHAELWRVKGDFVWATRLAGGIARLWLPADPRRRRVCPSSRVPSAAPGWRFSAGSCSRPRARRPATCSRARRLRRYGSGT